MNITKTLLTAGTTAALFGISLTGSAAATYDGDNNNWHHSNNANNWNHESKWNRDAYLNSYKESQAKKYYYAWSQNRKNWYAQNYQNTQSHNNWAYYDEWFTSKGYDWNHDRNVNNDWNEYNQWCENNNKHMDSNRNDDWEMNDFKNWHSDHMNKWYSQNNQNSQHNY